MHTSNMPAFSTRIANNSVAQRHGYTVTVLLLLNAFMDQYLLLQTFRLLLVAGAMLLTRLSTTTHVQCASLAVLFLDARS
jgi:hypothetical protein